MKKTPNFFRVIIDILISIACLPVILLGLIYIFVEWLKEPFNKKRYRKSIYFQELQLPYQRYIFFKPSYLFYNSARENGISLNFIHQKTNGFEYLIKNDNIYLFPWFDQISYSDEDKQWYVDLDGSWFLLQDEIKKQIAFIDDKQIAYKINILLSESMIAPRCTMYYETSYDELTVEDKTFAKELLPEFIKVGKSELDAYLAESEIRPLNEI
ncbi:MAG: hypothetical protein ACI4II_01925 [Acutalibacteraceae bacterium]